MASLAHVRSHVGHHIAGDAEEATHKNVLLGVRDEQQSREAHPRSRKVLGQEFQQPLVGGTETNEVTDDDGQDEGEAASINAVDSRLGDRLLRVLTLAQVSQKTCGNVLAKTNPMPRKGGLDHEGSAGLVVQHLGLGARHVLAVGRHGFAQGSVLRMLFEAQRS